MCLYLKTFNFYFRESIHNLARPEHTKRIKNVERNVNLTNVGILKMGHPSLFLVYCCSFRTISHTKKLVHSMIRTQIVKVVGKHDDHLTTTTALYKSEFFKFWPTSAKFLLF